jgi:sulfate/thiosulfate transport system substrate-binding protein
MRLPWLSIVGVVASAIAVSVIASKNVEGYASHRLLNVSYDPTRELYQKLDPAFSADYLRKTGESVEVTQSHGGSSYQARQVTTGAVAADVVTLGLPSDIEGIAKRGLTAADWRSRLPDDAKPYSSTLVFVVRKGNPLGIKDWPDLVRDNVEVITPDPKTSGNGKLTVLAAWGSVIANGGTEAQAADLAKAILDHAPFFVGSSRPAGVAFSVEKKGDVQIAWENEALREVAESQGGVEIAYPPLSILAEPSVALVDANVQRNHSETLAKAYLDFLYSDEAQNIIASQGYRPSNEKIAAKYADRLPPIKLFPITLIAKDWSDAQQKFFAENGVLDTIYKPKPRTE